MFHDVMFVKKEISYKDDTGTYQGEEQWRDPWRHVCINLIGPQKLTIQCTEDLFIVFGD